MPPSRRFMLCTGECIPAEQLLNYPESHIIGELYYMMYKNRKITLLALYELPRETNIQFDPDQIIRCYSIGEAIRIRCAKCKRFTNWGNNHLALSRLRIKNILDKIEVTNVT